MNFKLDHSNDFIFYPKYFFVALEQVKKHRVCMITQPRSGSHLLQDLIRIKSPSLGRLEWIHDTRVREFFYLLDRIQQDKKSIKYVYLTRKDILRRAISHIKIFQTKQATSLEKSERQPVYDFDRILREISEQEVISACTKEHLDFHGIEPLWITYKDLVENTDQTLRTIFDFCGFESERIVGLADTKLKKMGNAETEAWVERFRKDYADYREELDARLGQNIGRKIEN